MKKNYLKFLSLGFAIIGIFLLANSNLNLTGAVIGSSSISSTFSLFLGLAFVLVGIIIFASEKDGGLEEKINYIENIKKNKGIIEERKKNKDIFVKENYAKYKEYLEKEKKFPKGLSDSEKYDYAKKELENAFNPLNLYNERNALEFCEYFGSTPKRNTVPIQGITPIQMKTKVHYAINDPTLKAITEDASKNSRLWQTANKKIYNLTETGYLGSPDDSFKYVEDTNTKYLYLKDSGSGARVFLKKLDNEEYALIGICSGNQKKVEENMMISTIKANYSSEKQKKKK